MSLLEVSGLRKNFGGLEAIRGLTSRSMREDRRPDRAERSGKTTIFNLITGLLPASAGRAVLDGRHDLLGRKPHAITALGVARTFQNQRLFNQMTVLRMSGRPALPVEGRPGRGRLQLALRPRREGTGDRGGQELLAIFGQRLLPRADRLAYSLSYANRRRLEIARALAPSRACSCSTSRPPE